MLEIWEARKVFKRASFFAAGVEGVVAAEGTRVGGMKDVARLRLVDRMLVGVSKDRDFNIS